MMEFFKLYVDVLLILLRRTRHSVVPLVLNGTVPVMSSGFQIVQITVLSPTIRLEMFQGV